MASTAMTFTLRYRPTAVPPVETAALRARVRMSALSKAETERLPFVAVRELDVTLAYAPPVIVLDARPPEMAELLLTVTAAPMATARMTALFTALIARLFVACRLELSTSTLALEVITFTATAPLREELSPPILAATFRFTDRMLVLKSIPVVPRYEPSVSSLSVNFLVHSSVTVEPTAACPA